VKPLEMTFVLMMLDVKVKLTTRVRRAASASVGPGSSTSTGRPVVHLSRQTSDLSDVSTTTPVTPAPPATKSHPRRVRKHAENDSSSCSSTEALDQRSSDVWNDNPLYTDQRRQRQRKLQGLRRTRHIAVDTRPLDDILIETQQPNQQLTRSSMELDHPASTGNEPRSAPLQNIFKSEPDITAVRNTVIIHDMANVSDVDGCRSSMIDCISVAAPDDTVIKPSQLRESMRQRRTSSCADDSPVSRPGTKVSSTDQPRIGGDVALRRGGGSLRDTKQSSPFDRGTGLPSKNVFQNDASSSSPPSASAAVTSPGTDNELHGSVSRSAFLFTKSSSLSPSAETAHKKIVQSPVPEPLPSFPRHPADNTMSSVKTGNSRTLEANGVGNMSYDQLLQELLEVCSTVIYTVTKKFTFLFLR